MADDTDALLRDLESRASSSTSGKSPASAAGGDEDIEAFLRSLEGDDYVAPPEPASSAPAAKPVATVDAAADDRLGGLESAPDAPLQEKPKKLSRKEKKAQKAEQKAAAKEKQAKGKEGKVAVVERGESKGLKIAAVALKLLAVGAPLGFGWWVLGIYLANWVSAGWLILLVAGVTIFGVPAALLLLSKRGRYLWWTIATSLLIGVGLVAPFTGAASNAAFAYGHWPATAVAEVVGLDRDGFLVTAAATASGWIGGALAPRQEEDRGPLLLGSDDPLAPEPAEPVEPAEVESAPQDPATEDPATEEPATEEPAAAEEPAAEEPVAEEPATEEPAAAEEPAAEEPAAEQPAEQLVNEEVVNEEGVNEEAGPSEQPE